MILNIIQECLESFWRTERRQTLKWFHLENLAHFTISMQIHQYTTYPCFYFGNPVSCECFIQIVGSTVVAVVSWTRRSTSKGRYSTRRSLYHYFIESFHRWYSRAANVLYCIHWGKFPLFSNKQAKRNISYSNWVELRIYTSILLLLKTKNIWHMRYFTNSKSIHQYTAIYSHVYFGNPVSCEDFLWINLLPTVVKALIQRRKCNNILLCLKLSQTR